MRLQKRLVGPWFAVVWVFGTALALGADPVPAGAPVAVHLEDGRTLTGEVDAATDDEHLWLRTTAPGIAFSRAIAWNDIVAVVHGGKQRPAAEFRPIAEQIKTPLPEGFFASSEARLPRPPSPRAEPVRPNRVASLEIDARMANWDADAEPDGLEVRIRPLDDRGRTVRVNGDLDVRLVGQRIAGRQSPGEFPELGHWGESVRADEVKPFGATYRLPFRAVHPEVDPGVSPDGVVHARLGVPGQGVFEASVPVYLRTPGRLRDQLQLRKNVRVFPFERP
ncbi:MAG: hypothetical protein NUV77_03590 [Thermoguttaceae bacterium]|jgi:hypothetical protein|nr:hypothetical protein [Thermoguttaceae bacterium]